MKKWILAAFIVMGLTGKAQEIKMDLGNFSRIKVSEGLRVTLTAADFNKAVISGTNRKKVKISEKNGELEISINVSHLWKEDDTKIILFYKQFQQLEARQNSEIEITGQLKQPILQFNVQEGSEVTANIDVENLVSKIVTGGTLRLTGTADVQEINIRAAGEFKGENLVGKKIEVAIIGGGYANINAREYVKASTKAGGNIYIYGNPETIDQETTFGGTIKKIN